jgi:predicted nuclease of predicted toxin-antitoxin system
MKFLIDNALSPIIAQGLQKTGFESVHVRDIGLRSASDSVIFEHAFKNNQIIISADTDFGTLLALRQSSKPSVILFRCTDKRPHSQLSLLLSQLSEIKDALIDGSIVVFEDNRIRIRTLPVG